MNKTSNKGFTLIEIIGIVVILAVIMIVTVPMLETTLRNSDKKRIETFKKNLVLVCDNYIVNNDLLNQSNITIELSELLNQNYIDEIPEVLSDDPLATTSEGDKNYYSYVVAAKQNGEFKYQLCKTDNSCESIN